MLSEGCSTPDNIERFQKAEAHQTTSNDRDGSHQRTSTAFRRLQHTREHRPCSEGWITPENIERVQKAGSNQRTSNAFRRAGSHQRTSNVFRRAGSNQRTSYASRKLQHVIEEYRTSRDERGASQNIGRSETTAVHFSSSTNWVVGGTRRFSRDPLPSSGEHDGRFSRDPLPVISAGGHCEYWHGQGCPLFMLSIQLFSCQPKRARETTATPDKTSDIQRRLQHVTEHQPSADEWSATNDLGPLDKAGSCHRNHSPDTTEHVTGARRRVDGTRDDWPEYVTREHQTPCSETAL